MADSYEKETDKKAWVVAGQGKIEEDRKKFLDTKEELLKAQKVVVVDVNIPFGSMVILMVKWALASIPAFIVLIFVGSFVMSILRGLLG